MPSVPRYGNQQVSQSLGSQVKVSTEAPIAAFGGGEGLNKVVDSASSFIMKVKEQADDVAILEAAKKLNDFENETIYGKDGLITKKGRDAFGYKEQFDTMYKSKEDEILGSLSNEQQKKKFQKLAYEKKSSLDKSVYRHIAVERDQYDDQTTNDYISSEMNNAIQNYHNPERVAQSLYAQEQEFLKYADRKGLSPESTKMKLMEMKSQTHAGIISKMLDNGDDIAAEQYYKGIAKELDANSDRKVANELEIGSMRGQSQRFVDDIMRKGLSEGEAYKAAATIENPKLREAAEARIARQFNLKAQADQAQQEQLFNYAVGKFDQTGEMNIEPSVLARLKPEYRKALDSYRDQNPLRDDGINYYKIKKMAEDPATREKFLNHDLLLEKPNLNKQHFEELMDLKNKLKKGDTGILDGAYSDAQVIENIYESAGFSTKDVEDFAKFKLKADQDILDYKKATGKEKLSNDEVASLVKKNTVQVVVDKGWFWDTKKPKYLMDVDSIPEDSLESIKQFLSSKGKAVSDKNILEVYFLREGKK